MLTYRNRNLLPSDNFSESEFNLTICAHERIMIRIYLGYLTSSGPETLSSQPSRTGSSFSSSDARKNVSGFKIMTVTRGFTEEADKLLDYLVSTDACIYFEARDKSTVGERDFRCSFEAILAQFRLRNISRKSHIAAR